MSLKVIDGEKKKTPFILDRELDETESGLAAVKTYIDHFYRIVEENQVKEFPNLNACLLQTSRTNWRIPEIDDLITDFYCREESEEFPEGEFQLARCAIAMGLAPYFRYRTLELALIQAKLDPSPDLAPRRMILDEADLAQALDGTLNLCYPDPNDFVFEFRKFREWHSSSDQIKRLSFSYWTDLINYHLQLSFYLGYLQHRKEDLDLCCQGASLTERGQYRDLLLREFDGS